MGNEILRQSWLWQAQNTFNSALNPPAGTHQAVSSTTPHGYCPSFMVNVEAPLWFYTKDLPQHQLKAWTPQPDSESCRECGPDPLGPSLLLSEGPVSTPVPGGCHTLSAEANNLCFRKMNLTTVSNQRSIAPPQGYGKPQQDDC